MPCGEKKIGKERTGLLGEDDERGWRMTAGAFIYTGHVAVGRQSRSSGMADIERHNRLLVVLFERDRNVRRQDDSTRQRDEYDPSPPSHITIIRAILSSVNIQYKIMV